MKKTALLSAMIFLALNSSAIAGKLAEVQKEKMYADPTDEAAIVYIVRPIIL